jgi:hypothetical protein
VFRIRIHRVHKCLGLPDPDPFVRVTDTDTGARPGSVSHRYESADPDPYQNVTDPEQCLVHTVPICHKNIISLQKSVWRIRDVYPGSRILIFTHPGSRIPDPKTATKERGEKKFVVIPFLVVTNFTKLNIILFLKC